LGAEAEMFTSTCFLWLKPPDIMKKASTATMTTKPPTMNAKPLLPPPLLVPSAMRVLRAYRLCLRWRINGTRAWKFLSRHFPDTRAKGLKPARFVLHMFPCIPMMTRPSFLVISQATSPLPASPTSPGPGRRRMSSAAPGYLDGLNPEQREAVETTEGPLLVLAGAGTGKTRVLTTRLAHILATGKARPWEMLAVTFTNKAAREMRERITHIIGPEAEGLRWLGTFHSVAAQILRRHAELVGLKSNYTIIDTDDNERLLKQLIEAENIDAKRWTPRILSGIIDGWKNRGWTPDRVPTSEAGEFANGKGISLYRQYQERLRILNACDFGDLLLHNISLFTGHPDVLDEFQRRFKYVMVDEYQDTNVAQYLWLRLLAQGRQNVCCVGDDDQSIYGWRGAEVDNILRFERDFAGAKVVRLERNYRSTEHILAAASGLITPTRAAWARPFGPRRPAARRSRSAAYGTARPRAG
jgi:hypothetical protein